MHIYSVDYANEGEQPSYFPTLREAKARAREIAALFPFDIHVDRLHIGPLTKDVLIRSLNGSGWVQRSEVVYVAPAAGVVA